MKRLETQSTYLWKACGVTGQLKREGMTQQAKRLESLGGASMEEAWEMKGGE